MIILRVDDITKSAQDKSRRKIGNIFVKNNKISVDGVQITTHL